MMLKASCESLSLVTPNRLVHLSHTENKDFPQTHNLRVLLDKIPSEIDLPAEVKDAAIFKK